MQHVNDWHNNGNIAGHYLHAVAFLRADRFLDARRFPRASPQPFLGLPRDDPWFFRSTWLYPVTADTIVHDTVASDCIENKENRALSFVSSQYGPRSVFFDCGSKNVSNIAECRVTI